ncbi:hypothetical protein [Pseudomonas sp. Marseille-QA0892]
MVEIVKQPNALPVVSHGERGRPAENIGVRAYFDFEHLLAQLRPATTAPSSALPTADTLAQPQTGSVAPIQLPVTVPLDFTVTTIERSEPRDAASFISSMPELFNAPYLDETPPEDAWFEHRNRLALLGIA